MSNTPLAAHFNHEGYSQHCGWFQAIETSVLCGPLPAFVHCATVRIFAVRGVTGPPKSIMTLLRAMTLLSWAGTAAYAPPTTHRLRPRGLRAKRLPGLLRAAKRKADAVDHDDFDDSYALNDLRTNELRLPTMADLMRCLTQRHLRPASMASTRRRRRSRAGGQTRSCASDRRIRPKGKRLGRKPAKVSSTAPVRS